MVTEATAVQGTLGTDDSSLSSLLPLDYAARLERMDLLGDMALTALTMRSRAEKTDSYKFNWADKIIGERQGTILGVYNDIAMSSEYTTGNKAADAPVFVLVSAADSKNFIPGDRVMFEHAITTGPQYVKRGRVTALTTVSGGVLLAVYLTEADANDVVENSTTITAYSNASPEDANRVQAMSFQPNEMWNYTQILKASSDLSGSMMDEHHRYQIKPLQEARNDALKIFGRNQEHSCLLGVRDSVTGTNGKPERETMGMIHFINTYASDNVFDFRTDTDFSGQLWVDKGFEYLSKVGRIMSRYQEGEIFLLAGEQAFDALATLILAITSLQTTAMDKVHGLKVMRLRTPHCDFALYKHPRLSRITSMSRAAIVMQMENLAWRYKRHVKFYPIGIGAGVEGRDAQLDQWIAEGGWQFKKAPTWGIVSGLGADNTLA